MKIPGFGAEESLYKGDGVYHVAGEPVSDATALQLAASDVFNPDVPVPSLDTLPVHKCLRWYCPWKIVHGLYVLDFNHCGWVPADC
jgi:hypothetical protein